MATLFPFRPNWARGYEVTYEFATDVASFRNGTEQRRSQRMEPRRSFDFSVLETGEAAKTLRTLISGAHDERFYLPDYGRRSSTAVAAAAAATFVTLSSAQSWAVPGARVVLDDGKTSQVASISGATGPLLALSGALVSAVPIGARVFPVVECYLNDSVTLTPRTSAVLQVDLSFLEYPGEGPVLTGVAWPKTYAGDILFDRKPNWAEQPKVKVESEREFFDFEKGKMGFLNTFGYSSSVFQFGHTAKNETEIESLLGMFLSARGKCRQFWLPSEMADATLALPIAPGGTQIFLVGNNIALHMDSPIYRHLRIVLNNGVEFVRAVSSFAVSGLNSRLDLDSPLVPGVAVSDVRSISWVYAARFATDSLVASWITDSVMETTMSFVTLRAAA